MDEGLFEVEQVLNILHTIIKILCAILLLKPFQYLLSRWRSARAAGMEEEEEIVIAIVAVTAAEIGGGLAPATDPGTGTGSGEWKCRTCLTVSSRTLLTCCVQLPLQVRRQTQSVHREAQARQGLKPRSRIVVCETELFLYIIFVPFP